MSLFSRYMPQDITDDPEEQRLYDQLNAQQKYQAQGSTAGTVIGAGLGAAAGMMSGGALSIPMMQAGAGLGSGVGGFLGQQFGAGQSEAAQRRLQQLQEEKQKKLLERQGRLSSVGELLGTYLPRGL